jgi:hypothetical protein
LPLDIGLNPVAAELGEAREREGDGERADAAENPSDHGIDA